VRVASVFLTRLGAALPALAAITAAALLGGCPGTLEDKEKFLAGTCPDIPALFAQRCTTSGCHGATDMAGQLDLASPDLASRVSGVPSAGDCAGRVLADPNDPEGSVLYFKLEPSPPCGSKMPLTGTPLVEREIACVREWILSLQPGGSGTGGGGGAGGAGAGGAGGAGTGGAGGV
jgi:hypothetical protein